MAIDVQLAITVATVVLNLALAIAVGATLAWRWLARGASAWCGAQLRSVRRARLCAMVAAIISMGLLLLFVSASMAEVPLLGAGEAVRSMLTQSHFGVAWRIGMSALVAAAILPEVLPAARWKRTGTQASLLALAVFLYARSMISHASANGDFNVAMAADWIHLCLISVWVGEVFVAGLLTLRGQAPMQGADRADMARYIENLSTSATVALGGIFATGVFSAWHNLGSVAGLSGNLYGTALIVKLGMVALAVLLGAFNRFIVMPPLLAGLRTRAQQVSPALGRFTFVLRIEAVVLLGVLVAAAVLSATSPPTAA